MDKAGSTTRPGAGAPGPDVVARDVDAPTGPLPTVETASTTKPATKQGKPPAQQSGAKPATAAPAKAPVAQPAKPAAAPPAAPTAAPAAARPAAATVGAAVGSATTVTPTLPPLAAEQRPQAATVRPVGPRRARLLLTRLDPWSVMKTAFMLSVSLAVVVLVAIALLWWTLSVTGVFDAIGRTIDDVAGSTTTSFDFLSLVGFSRVMGVALVLAAIEIVLVSALTTLFAFLYNLSVGLTGGLEVTLSEDS